MRGSFGPGAIVNEILLPPQLELWPRKAFFKRMLWTAAGACALGGLYGLRFEDHWVRIERREMPLPDLGEEFSGATLAHISDLHCSPIVLERYLGQCVSLINSLEVDFVAITGDFVTGPRHYARRVARVLGELRPKTAAVACLGNHDYGVFHPRGLGGVRGLSGYVSEQLARADIFVMLNETRIFRRGSSAIQFVGVEDYWTPRYNPPLAFEMARPHVPTVALAHNPDAAITMARYGADWVLAGHTHGTISRGGRIGELVFPTHHKRFSAGYYSLGDQKRLYVSRGLGYGRRVRRNARPEIALFTLRRAEPRGLNGR